MFKKVSPGFVVITVVVLILSSLMIGTASAQEGALDPNTAVSNIGGVLSETAPAEGVSTEPFQGSGKLAPEAAQLAGPHTSAGPVGRANPESVILPDSRTKVTVTTTYPHRAIAYLLVTWANNSKGSCTGWFIGPRTVVTAGHCVYNTDAGAAHGWAKIIRVYPGRNGASIPYSSTTSHQLFTVAGWTTAGNPAYDYGAIEVNAALGNNVGWFGWRWQASNTFAGNYTVQGYPGDKPTATQWKMAGVITHVNTYRLWYEIDSYGGQSGSPLHKPYANVCCYGFGIHTYGVSVAPFFGNSATRITSAVSTNLTNWKASAYP